MLNLLRQLATKPRSPAPAPPRAGAAPPVPPRSWVGGAAGPVDHIKPPRPSAAGIRPAYGRAGPGINARYDAAQTTSENRRHWMQADHLSAAAALTPAVRRVLRARARYEVANNGYARGMVNALANHVVGTGPRLQMLTDDPEANRRIERAFARWAKAVRLAHKLWTMRVSQCESGEVFAVLATNPAVASEVQLDLRLVEADQVTAPTMASPTRRSADKLNPRTADPTSSGRDASAFDNSGATSGGTSGAIPGGGGDGVVYDGYGNPVAYLVLRRHPGDGALLAGDATADAFDVIPAESVIHLYRAERPGQRRGVPEITSSLSLFAMLRRYTLASLSAAEQAALPSGVIYSDAPADPDAAASVEPMDEVELDRGTWLTMPMGWKIGQVKAEQPATAYGDFKHELINEIARPLNMPFNIAAGNSAGYNYASGRLDHQSFYKAIRIDQQYLADVVLDRVLWAWLNEAVLVEGLLPQWMRSRGALDDAHFRGQWFWDGLEHVDPAKEANAQATRLSSHTTTMAAEFARQGLDWENELRQRAKEITLLRELGLTSAPPEAAPPEVDPDPSDDDSDDAGDDERDTDLDDDEHETAAGAAAAGATRHARHAR